MILLDTAVVLWTLLDSPRLGARARARIVSATAVHVSAVSLAEIGIKSMLGKLEVPDDIEDLLRHQGLVGLPLTGADSMALTSFTELMGHDPFDRLLVAQAFQNRLTLLTSDRVLLGLGRDFVIDATV